jgi:hypothetical protein
VLQAWCGVRVCGWVNLLHQVFMSCQQHQKESPTGTTADAHPVFALVPGGFVTLSLQPSTGPPHNCICSCALLYHAGASPTASTCPNASPSPNPSSSTPAATPAAAASPRSSPSRSACGCRRRALAAPTTQRQCKAQADLHKPAEPR